MDPNEQFQRAARSANRAARVQLWLANMQLLPFLIGGVLLLAVCGFCGWALIF